MGIRKVPERKAIDENSARRLGLERSNFFGRGEKVGLALLLKSARRINAFERSSHGELGCSENVELFDFAYARDAVMGSNLAAGEKAFKLHIKLFSISRGQQLGVVYPSRAGNGPAPFQER